MARNRGIVGIVSLVLAVVAVALGLYSCEVTSNSYSTYQEAEANGAVGQYKWLPAGLPTTARDIRESHDVDSNEVWFTFVYDGVFEPAPDTCESVERGSVQMRQPKRWDRFPGFVKKARVDAMSPGMVWFFCMGESFRYFLAVDRPGRRAIGWSNGG
jgi:hypothetical protein